MKSKKDWLISMSHADEKYVKEADPSQPRRRSYFDKRIIGALAACICILVCSLWLFIPYNTNPPSIEKYEGSEYYTIIDKINTATYTKPAHKNNYDYYNDILASITMGCGASDPDYDEMPSSPDMDGSKGEYEEVTDNQTEGVTEADKIKRSTEYIYYLYSDKVEVYSIVGENSALAGSYLIHSNPQLSGFSAYGAYTEMFLSQDCSTLTVIIPGYTPSDGAAVRILSLDVTDPSDINEKNNVTVFGSYESSRSIDGHLLLFSEYAPNKKNIDFDDPKTYLPTVDIGNGRETLSADDIISPDVLSNIRYTTVTVLDEATLSLLGICSFLSYSDCIYVSENNIFATRTYNDIVKTEGSELITEKAMTEIAVINYNNDQNKLINKGSFSIEGIINDRFSLDEYEGILRAVTTTDARQYHKNNSHYSLDVIWSERENANLYCISVDSFEILSSVVAFAPEGESVRSVRFDKNMAYVCTSIELKDPVFFFDLTDIYNITYTDTGTIDGFSTSLISFGDGYLLGIGVGAGGGLKLEVYEEGSGGVVSVASIEYDASYSTEYKSYLIDRNNSFIGMTIDSYSIHEGQRYVLILFDGYNLVELSNEPIFGDINSNRGVYIDGYLYMLGSTGLTVKKI